jgi:hypothetical protein
VGSGTAKVKRLSQIKLERSVVLVPPKFLVDEVLVFVCLVRIVVSDVTASFALLFGLILFA